VEGFFCDAGVQQRSAHCQWAASVTRVPLKQVHRIVDAGLLRGRVKTRNGSRVMVGSGPVRLAWLTAETLTPAARRRIVETAIAGEAVSVVADNPLRLDLKPIVAEVKTGLSRLKKAKAMVTRDPDVLGGQPVFAGTRVPVHDVANMLANADTAEAIRLSAAHPRPDRALAARLASDSERMRNDGARESEIRRYAILVEQSFNQAKPRILSELWAFMNRERIVIPPTTP
jgi:Protein of unknown function (DUF433)